MKIIRKLLAACVMVAGLSMTIPASAEESKLPNLGDGASASAIAKESVRKDALCTRCHDETEMTPLLSIYQTKHGVKGDPRTPTCQSSTGESEKHLKGDPAAKGRAAPDIVFKRSEER